MTPRRHGAIALASGPEFDLIRRFWGPEVPLARSDVRVGPGDDCAVVVGQGIALSTDLSVEGTHFRRDWLDARGIGFRAAAGALSDLAAVAARPIGVLASVAVDAADAGAFAVELMDGVREAARGVGAALLGGDLARTAGPAVIDIVAVGECARPVLRSGARVGDELWVTGRLGGAAACVARLLRGEAPPPHGWPAFARPTPRLAEALWLREREIPRAMIDLSDGLAGDAAHLAAASVVRLALLRGAIPIHPAALVGADSSEASLRLALAGGEDYELLFAARPGAVDAHAGEFAARFGVRLTRVGRVVPGAGVGWEAEEGGLGLHGFQHFAPP